MCNLFFRPILDALFNLFYFNMKKTLLSSIAIAAFSVANAQSFVNATGFNEEFSSADKTEDAGSDREIFWYGCGITAQPTDADCNSADYDLTRSGNGKLSVATTKPVAAGNWAPMGFSLVNAGKDQTVDISSNNTVSVSYTNTSSSTVEVYWLFASSSDNGTTLKLSSADGTGASWGGVVAAGATKTLDFDLSSGTRTSWELDEAGCAAKGGVGGGAAKCIWDDGFDVKNLYSIDITITGEATAASSWAPAALSGETVEFDYIKGGTQDNSSNEVVASALNVYPNPASDVLNVKFDATAATTVELTDLTGKVVATQQAQAGAVNATFATATVNAGVYFVNVKNANGSTTQKVVIK